MGRGGWGGKGRDGEGRGKEGKGRRKEGPTSKEGKGRAG